jgi:hypothetical protein
MSSRSSSSAGPATEAHAPRITDSASVLASRGTFWSVERQPTQDELAEARDRARADAHLRVEAERARPSADEPIVEDAGPYEFAPEDVRAEYERVFEETLTALRQRG